MHVHINLEFLFKTLFSSYQVSLSLVNLKPLKKKKNISYLIPQLSTSRSTNCTSTDVLTVSAIGQGVRTAHSGIKAFHYINVMKKPVISVNMI